MRCFFALEPDAASKLAIAAWRDKALPPFPTSVPAANFHITLAFLGQLARPQLDTLLQQVEQFSLPPQFFCSLNHVGYWAKPKILCLGVEQPPAPLTQLAKGVTHCAVASNLSMPKRRFMPHLTLVRNSKVAPPTPLYAPAFTLHFSQFHLFESVATRSGVAYAKLASWNLPPYVAKNTALIR